MEAMALQDVLDPAIEPLDLAVIRYVTRGALLVLLLLKGNGLMVSPSGTWDAGSTKVRADRR